MKKIMIIAALVVGFCALVPQTASAQESFGITILSGGRGGGFSFHYESYGYRGGYHWENRDWHDHCRPRYDDCGRGGYHSYPARRSIVVYVEQVVSQRVWDPYWRCYVYRDRVVRVPVTAHWDHRLGGYYYVDSYGRYVRAR